MRKVLLTSAAVTALLAGPTLAFAQTPSESRQPPAASSQQTAPKGSAQEDKRAAPKASESTPSSDRKQTTGSQSSPTPGAQPSGSSKSGGSDMKKSGASDMKKSGGSDMKKDTTGTSQGAQGAQPDGQKPAAKPTAEPKAGPSMQKNERSTTGQSPSAPQTKGDRATPGAPPAAQPERKDQRQAPSGTAGQTQPGTPPPAQPERAGQRQAPSGAAGQLGQPGTASSVSVTQEHQSKFNEVIEKQKVKPVTNVNFSVSVGSNVPRSVRLYDVPRDIVTVYPEYRGKKFVVVRDEIVIIEPGTQKVVAVMPRSGAATSGTSTSVRQTTATTSSRLQLAPEKRRVIREIVIKEQSVPRCQEIGLSVGAEVSRTIRLNPFPEEVVREVPEMRSYRFCVKDNDVVLVDPNEHRIVEVID
jgi:hypothetical protein